MSNDIVKTDTPGVILAKIFKVLLFELGINIDRYQYFMLNFIKHLDIAGNYKISSLINNITKEVFYPSISWKVFIKALIFLGTNKFTIFLQSDSKAPIVYYTIDLSDKTMASNLFCFSGKEEDQEEHKLGMLLKEFLILVLKQNNLTLDYSDAISDFIFYQKRIGRYENKSLKGNLLKEFKKKTISWKVFIKAMIVYRITNPVIGVTIYNKMNKQHTVSFTINLEDSNI